MGPRLRRINLNACSSCYNPAAVSTFDRCDETSVFYDATRMRIGTGMIAEALAVNIEEHDAERPNVGQLRLVVARKPA